VGQFTKIETTTFRPSFFAVRICKVQAKFKNTVQEHSRIFLYHQFSIAHKYEIHYRIRMHTVRVHLLQWVSHIHYHLGFI